VSLEVIQIIEDDQLQAGLIDREVRRAGYRTNVAHDGATGLADVRRLHPSLVLLDVMLPELDGHEVCRQLRGDRRTAGIPIIMISALGTEEHKTAGLELGADDYLVKPFGLAELISRIRAVLRRSAGQTAPHAEGDLSLEEDRYVALFRGGRVTLSGIEWTILRRLSGSAGRVVMREELIHAIWGRDGLIHDHELERHVKAIRQKLGDDPACPRLIMSSATGYILTAGTRESGESVPQFRPAPA
jgi:DNA-binding response OmpR family regulator